MSAIVDKIVEELQKLDALPSRIFLVGLPACGKTKRGKKIAKAIGHSFLDTDRLIEEREKISIQEIFTHIGELYFRDLEKTYLRKLTTADDSIIATGGGMPCFNNNMEWMNKNGYTIWINEPIEIIVERLHTKSEKRPMTSGLSLTDIDNKVKALYNRREEFYLQAQLIV